MSIVHNNLSNFSDGVFVRQVIRRLIAAIPGRFVVHQNLNLALARRFFDRVRIFQADRQRFFHHHGNSIPRADFHHAAMIVGVGVREHRLRMRGL